MTFKELMKNKGFSNYSLAKKMNNSYATISRWANGKNEPSCSQLLELSKILNVSIKNLVCIFANKGGEENGRK